MYNSLDAENVTVLDVDVLLELVMVMIVVDDLCVTYSLAFIIFVISYHDHGRPTLLGSALEVMMSHRSVAAPVILTIAFFRMLSIAHT